MWQIVACVGAYIGFSLVVTARLAYLVGRHRGLHVRNEGGSVVFLKEDGRSRSCDHRYCDDAEVPIMYFFSLFLLPVFLLLLMIFKFVGFAKKGGFNSVQLPENACPGIEITEVRLKNTDNSFWWRFTFLLTAATICGWSFYYVTHR